MDRPSDDVRDRQQDEALEASGGIRISDDGNTEGVGTPEGGTDTGISGVTRLSAPPGETDGYGSEVRPGNRADEDQGQS